MTIRQLELNLKKKFLFTVDFCIVLLVTSIFTFIYGYNLTQTPILAVLLIHDVVENPKNQWEITPKKLEFYIEKLLALNYKPVDPNNFEELLNNGFEGRNFMVTFDDGTANEYEAIVNIYKKYKIISVLFLIDDFINQPNNLSETEILKLKNDYKTFLGLHGKHHKQYTEQLKNKIDLGKITEESRTKLNTLFQTNIKWLAYPFGDYNQEVIDELKAKTSIDLAFTVESGNINKDANKMSLNRYMYMGGLNPENDDTNYNFCLLPPESFTNGKYIISLSLMIFFFFISRVYLSIKYYKLLKMNKQNDL